MRNMDLEPRHQSHTPDNVLPRLRVIERCPTSTEYRHLCESVGWGEIMNFEAAARAVPRSLYAVVACIGDQIVGMGRIVGDGAIFYYIQDVAVDPSHQGKGIGQRLLETLVGWVQAHAPEKSFLGLFSAKGTQAFYERFGFAAHKNDIGMFQVIRTNQETPHN